MTWLDIVLWSAVPFNYLFWIVIYPRLKKNERVSEDV
jgi:hypothetical protein